MTSWMECGCGGDVTLYENLNVEYYGRTWPMVLIGTCGSCGMQHITVPACIKPEWDRAREEYEAAQADCMAKYKDGLYHGAVGSNQVCEDEDFERCTAKLMAWAWHHLPRGVWILKDGKPVKEWTYYEAAQDGWFDYHLKMTKWVPIRGGDDADQYDEELCLQTMDQVKKYLCGRIVSWELWHRGADYWKIGGGALSIQRRDRILEVFA